jgi:hypothetical protein
LTLKKGIIVVAQPIAHGDLTPTNIISVVRDGLPVTELIDLQASPDVPADRLAPMLGISEATFHRRKGAGSKLNPAAPLIIVSPRPHYLALSPSRKAIDSNSTRTASSIGITGRTSKTNAGNIEQNL